MHRAGASRPQWSPLLLGLAVVVGAVLPAFLLLVRMWGFRIPQASIELDYLFGVVWAVVLGITILFWPAPARDKSALIAIWIIKCAVTLGFMLVYEWYYELDTFIYFERSRAPFPPFSETGFGNGTENVYAITWILNRFMPDSFHAMKVTFSMVGLLAVYLTYRGAVRFWGKEEIRLLFLLALYPSILFWSSILGKDPLQLFGIALYTYGVMSWRVTGRGLYALPVIAGILLSAYIRIWTGVILIVPLAIFVLIGLRGHFSRFLFLCVTMFGLYLASEQMVERFQLETMDDLFARADHLTRGWEGGSAQTHDVAFTDLRSMITFAPFGMFAALFRPLPGEVMNPFGLLAGVENLALLCLLALALVRARWSRIRDPLILCGIALVLMWSGLYAFVSYYNLGAAVRFKLQILPVLLCLLLYLAARTVPDRHSRAEPAATS
jgi:hypothetical protein